jgi:drug/metabolite transporter (DMT)-like permease
MRGRVLVAFAAIYVIWGSTYLAIAYAIESIPPLLMMGIRSVVAGGILYGWARLRGVGRPAGAAWASAAIAGAFLFLGGHGLLAWAELRVPSGVAALIVATGTVWMIVVEWAWPGGRRPATGALAGAVLGIAGVGLLMGGGAGGVDVLGAAALTAASLSWSIGSIYGRHSSLPTSPAQSTGMQLLAGGALLIGAAAASGELGRFDVGAIDLRAALSLGYLIVFGSVAGFTAYVWLMQRCSPVKVSTHNFVNPVVAVLIGWVFAGERLTPRMMLAGGVIVLAILLIYGVRRKHGAVKPPQDAAGPTHGDARPAVAVRRPTAVAPSLTLPGRLRPGVRS